MSDKILCGNCKHVREKLIEDTVSYGKEYTKTIYCKLGYRIWHGSPREECDFKPK